MEHQHYFGRKFYIDKKTGYWISTDYPRVRAHVWVWTRCRGEIEKGMHVHHIDGNKSNNDISNLQVITPEAHLMAHLTEERINYARKWMEVIRPLTKEWHSSKEGRIWHSNHARITFLRKNPMQKVCDFCSKQYEVDKVDTNSKFCSSKCKSACRRKSGVDDVEKVCEFCCKTFMSNKYGKIRLCSRACSASFRKGKVHKKAVK